MSKPSVVEIMKMVRLPLLPQNCSSSMSDILVVVELNAHHVTCKKNHCAGVVWWRM